MESLIPSVFEPGIGESDKMAFQGSTQLTYLR
jgi:hypothetical protein